MSSMVPFDLAHRMSAGCFLSRLRTLTNEVSSWTRTTVSTLPGCSNIVRQRYSLPVAPESTFRLP